MTATKAIASALLAGIFFANGAAPLQAADAASKLTMKPLHGISFDVGTQRAVSYFLNKDGRCELVLTLAEAPDRDNAAPFSSTRFEATIGAGKTTRFDSNAGKAIEFACGTAAQSLSVNSTKQISLSAPSPKLPSFFLAP